MTTSVTCLGCGCACDDIEVVTEAVTGTVTRESRIVEAKNACELGLRWFGDGRVPSRASVAGRDVDLDTAIAAAAQLLRKATRPLVYLAPDLSCEAQREAVGIADALGAGLDSVTSATAMASILAAQERGRAGATLGEVRRRADVVVFWGIDPAAAYPRYVSRYAPESATRTIIRVDIAAADEVATLTALTAVVSGRVKDNVGAGVAWDRARELAPRLLAGRYIVIVADGEPDEAHPRDPGRAGALISLAQALNGPARAALSLLRAGGNRTGADAVMTSQTGYPAAVDFTHGYPRYQPYDGTAAAHLARTDVDAVLVVGAAALIPSTLLPLMARLPRALIGPRASESVLAPGDVAVDTGIAGIHDGGTVLRMDDVPLPLRPTVTGPPSAVDVIAALGRSLR